MMTNRPTIRKMSKDYEMTKFRELLDTKEDDSVLTMDWLVRQSPSREERVLAMAMDTKRALALRKAMSTEIYSSYKDNPSMSGIVRRSRLQLVDFFPVLKVFSGVREGEGGKGNVCSRKTYNN